MTASENGAQHAHDHDHDHDHDRVEDDEGTVDYSRLVGEIEGIVRLVEQHRPGVRRAVFDSYVTAVTEFGATAEQLGLIDLRDPSLDDEDADADDDLDEV